MEAGGEVCTIDDANNITDRGSVDLNRSEVEIGLPGGGANYLNLVFSSSTFLARARGTTGFDRYFRIRPGYECVANANYAAGTYDVILKEKRVCSN